MRAWHFREFLPGDNLSDPDFTKALFASDDEASLGRSLIREAIQNSLDAQRPDATAVTVRIGVFRFSNALSPREISEFLSGAWPHVCADDAGLEDPPTQGERVPFLVIEDFGTHGLVGDPEHWQPTEISSNGFYLFFRALGRSGKSDEERGRWGVGKFVFPMSSRAHMIWGLTVPSDSGSPLLMGRAVLRTHTIGPQSFHPDGHWGDRLDEGSRLVSPVRDPETVQRFVERFRLERGNEPGLSVVVPYVDRDIAIPILRHSAIVEYFLPLLRGELSMELAHDGGVEIVDGHAVREFVSEANSRSAQERLALAIAVTDGETRQIVWPQIFRYDDMEWSSALISDGVIEELRDCLESGQAVSVVLRLVICSRMGAEDLEGRIVVHLRRVEGLGNCRPLLIRAGISVAGERTKALLDHVSILLAEDCPVATMIGDAETPAHEQLQHDLLKGKYQYPRKMISFVRDAASNLLRTVWEADQADDPFALANYFPLISIDGRKADKPTPRKRGNHPEPEPTLPEKPRRFNIRKTADGFRVEGNRNATTYPEELSISVAYDVRRGNPFKRYRRFDFDLETLPRSVIDCELASIEPNRIVARPSSAGFAVGVSGFDSRRDLVVRVVASGGE